MEIQQGTPWSQTNLTDTPFYKVLAKIYLAYLGNTNPKPQHISAMQSLLLEGSLNQPLTIDLLLNQQEQQYLHLAAQGKKLKQIALELNRSQKEMSECHQSLLQKLDCKTISRAIIIGIRFGEIKEADFSTKV